MLTRGLVVCTWIGFIMAALGDLQKSVVKANKGEDTLVTGGIFRFLRHPNFTGETLGWTSSFLAALSVGNWRADALLLVASAIGWVGIVFVLAMASTNLEKKQKEKYGDLPEYGKWVERSWAGITLKKKEET
jgi:steroid 5-alpha reductase family enzyme